MGKAHPTFGRISLEVRSNFRIASPKNLDRGTAGPDLGGASQLSPSIQAIMGLRKLVPTDCKLRSGTHLPQAIRQFAARTDSRREWELKDDTVKLTKWTLVFTMEE